MKVSLSPLKNLLENNVCEIKFARRRPKPGEPPTRRMLCTNSFSLLNSLNGKLLLNYKQPKKLPKFSPAAKNLIVTWDILMQDYRCINVDACEVISTIPASEKFWEYFNTKLRFMTIQEKERFMDV